MEYVPSLSQEEGAVNTLFYYYYYYFYYFCYFYYYNYYNYYNTKPIFLKQTKQKTTEIFLSQKYHYQNGFDTLILPKNCCNTIIMNNGIQITHDNSPPLKIGVQISPK